MGRPVADKSGRKFGRLTVLRQDGFIGKNAAYACVCECGKAVRLPGGRLREGGTQSCGCFASEVHSKAISTLSYRHGLSRSRTYEIYQSMLARCFRQSHKHYRHYGGRGITPCDEWLGENGFKTFVADMGEAPEGMTLDREKNDLGYSKQNCRWAPMKVQNNNSTRNRIVSFSGKSQTVAQWAEELGIPYDALFWRVTRSKMTIEQALSEPIDRQKQINARRRIVP